MARKDPHVSSTSHGQVLQDDYRWMHALSMETKWYMGKEYRFTEAYFAQRDVQRLSGQYLAELRAAEAVTIEGCPELAYGYFYYSRERKGKNFPQYFRKKATSARFEDTTAPEELVLDINEEGRGHKFISVSSFELSPSQELISFSKDVEGNEEYSGVVKRIATNQVIDTIPSVVSMTWMRDSNHIVYTAPDEHGRPAQVFLRKIGSGNKPDRLLYEEKDAAFFLDVTPSKDKAFVIISSNSKNTSEVRVMDSTRPDKAPLLVAKRKPGVRYFLDHADSCFFLATNSARKKGPLVVQESHQLLQDRNLRLLYGGDRDLRQLLEAGKLALDASIWRPIYRPEDDTSLEDCDIVKGSLICYERKGGSSQITVSSFKDGSSHRVPLPSDVATVQPGGNVDFYSNTVRFSLTSPNLPMAWYDYDVEKRQLRMVESTTLPGYNPDDYSTTVVQVPSTGGVQVPMVITRHNDAADGAPALVQAYGAYGVNTSLSFESRVLPLLSRGWTIARPFVRGGGELGPAWHSGGKLMNKMNSFLDLIACAERLQQDKAVAPGKICAKGASAGGLLVAGAVNMRPDLFKAVIAEMPFVNCLDSMLDTKQHLTAHEYSEWGNPTASAKEFDCIRAYDPYHNVREGVAYPAMFVSTASNDKRVPYWGPLKWVARMRALGCHSAERPLILSVDHAGHGGDHGRYTGCEEAAQQCAFLDVETAKARR